MPRTIDRTLLAILIGGAALVALACAAARLNAGTPLARFWDNAHWTLGAATALALCWRGWRLAADSDDRRVRGWFTVGHASYLVGQLVWDVQVATGWNPFPAPADLFYLGLAPAFAAGLTSALRARRAVGLAAGLDALGIALAVAALVSAVYLPLGADNGAWQTATSIAYPALFLAVTGVAVVALFCLRVRPQWGGASALIVGLLALSLLWMQWNARVLADGGVPDGTWLGIGFSLANLVIGLGCATWRGEPTTGGRYERFCFVALRVLPLLLVPLAVAALLLAPPLGRWPGSAVALAALAVLTVAVMRQSLLLRERDLLVAAERALDESEDRLRRFAENIQAVFWIADPHSGRIVYCSPAYERLWGRSREALYADRDDWIAGIHPDDRARVIAAWRSAGERWEDEYRVVRPDGSLRRVRDRGFLTRGEDGCVQRITGIVEDVSERSEAADALRDSENRYRTLFENAPEALVVLDLARGCFVDANSRASALFGIPREQLLRSDPLALSPEVQPDGRRSAEVVPDWIARACAGETPAFPWTHRNAAGEDIACEIHLVRLPGPGTLIRGSIVDVRERQRLERALREAQKLESIGRLAGGVAHDFNNLLTAILGHLDLAAGALPAGAPARRHLEVATLAGQRGADLTRQLLAFARRQLIDPRVVDPNQLLREAEQLLRRVLGEDIDLVVDPGAANACVRVDPGQLMQVVMNLALNARDAMPGGGRLTLATGQATVDAEAAGRLSDLAPGAYATLAVADTGTGIAPDVRRHLFEPFFTTKDPGKGTGLGLATCWGIVKQNHGHIAVDSTPGRGSTFTVWLPVVAAAESAAAVETAPTASGGQETILIAEDDPLLRDLVGSVLAGHGYRVLTAEDGIDALDQARRHAGIIDLLLSDVVMPRLGGVPLAETLAAERPGLRVLFVTGYAEKAAVTDGVVPAGMTLLPKPFLPSQLVAKVREVLDAPAATAD